MNGGDRDRDGEDLLADPHLPASEDVPGDELGGGLGNMDEGGAADG
ncbi:MAG: hypothetical protein ABR591_15190 [Candidatus Velthaea sp.]